MQELIQQVLTEIRSAWRFRWWAMVTAWIICIVGWSAVFFLPDQFEGEARFYVNTTTRLDEVMGGVIIDADEGSQINLVRQAMLSGPVLERVARDTDLDHRATTPLARERLLEGLRKGIRIETSGSRRDSNDGIYRISYRDMEREKSLAVVANLLDIFKEDVISGRAEGSDETVQFLTKEISDYRTQLREREQAIADFKRTNMGLLPGSDGGYFERLQMEISENRRLEASLDILKERRRALTEQLRGERPMVDSDGSSTAGGLTGPRTELDARIIALENSIQELMTRYTEKWPDVIAAKDQLSQLYKQRDRELAELAAAGGEPSSVLSNNPVYQEIQIALNETDIEIRALQGEIAGNRQEIQSLQGKVDVIPDIEAKLAELTRDHDQVKAVYSELRERLEQERLRRNRIGWDGVTFQIIDPPTVGIEPVAPNRPRLLISVLLGGLIAGAGLAYLLQQLKSVFFDARTLRKATGLPVLGSVSMTWLSHHKLQRRAELSSLFVAALAIVGVLVVALVYQEQAVDIAGSIKRMASR